MITKEEMTKEYEKKLKKIEKEKHLSQEDFDKEIMEE